jgi:hypothetical protein
MWDIRYLKYPAARIDAHYASINSVRITLDFRFRGQKRTAALFHPHPLIVPLDAGVSILMK